MPSPTPGPAARDARVLPLAGADNVRDLGRLPTLDGRRTRLGRLYRGELLSALVDADVELLIGQAGLRTVIDLRSREEVRDTLGNWLEHEVAWVHCPFRLGKLAPMPGPGANYVAAYLSFLEADPAPVLLAARTLMSPESHPALFHCAAGKDRTGVLSALLLDVLGVHRSAIAEDYAMTSEGLPRVLERLVAMKPYRRMLEGTVPSDHEARAENMIAFLQALDERHGGAEAWLAHHGLSPDVVARFRDAMLVSELA
jgi:protein tyrosine/serine phosphatase